MTAPIQPRARRIARPGLTLLTALIVALCGLSGGLASTAGAGGSATVTLKDVAFHPATLRVSKGTTVKFRWNDGITRHNVSSRGHHHFKSASTRSKGQYSVHLTKAGTYRYECTIHPGMSGRIVVH